MKIKFNNGEFECDPATQDVKVEVCDEVKKVKRYLQSYEPGLKLSYLCFDEGKKRGEAEFITFWENCNFLEIEPQESEYYTAFELMDKYLRDKNEIIKVSNIKVEDEDEDIYLYDIWMSIEDLHNDYNIKWSDSKYGPWKSLKRG